jgi:hypothetical protein
MCYRGMPGWLPWTPWAFWAVTRAGLSHHFQEGHTWDMAIPGGIR